MCFAVQMSWIESFMLFYWSSWSILFFATIWQTRKFVLIETLWPVLVSSPSQKLSSLWKLPTFSLKPLQVFFSKAASKYKSHTFVAKWSVATLSKHLKYPEINTYWKYQEKACFAELSKSFWWHLCHMSSSDFYAFWSCTKSPQNLTHFLHNSANER